ncbi:MAG TPA: IPTL-CTERM sorting domain-containing protein [Pseudomonadota bacterium]|nr:IPTL-CTERM sorting domain-containing protein [Pseudomonadota bacterium]
MVGPVASTAIVARAAVTAAPIPTLSAWALALVTVLLALGGCARLAGRRR